MPRSGMPVPSLRRRICSRSWSRTCSPLRRPEPGGAAAAAARSPGPAGGAGGAGRPPAPRPRRRCGRDHAEPGGDRPRQAAGHAIRHGAGHPVRLAAARGASLCPADAALSLPACRPSHALARLAAVEAVRGSFEAAHAAITRRCGPVMGKRQAGQAVVSAACDIAAFYAARIPVPCTASTLLVLSADAKGIVMRPQALRPETARAAARQGRMRTRLTPRGETLPQADGHLGLRLRHRAITAPPARHHRPARRAARAPHAAAPAQSHGEMAGRIGAARPGYRRRRRLARPAGSGTAVRAAGLRG
jgi:hypothetical protein